MQIRNHARFRIIQIKYFCSARPFSASQCADLYSAVKTLLTTVLIIAAVASAATAQRKTSAPKVVTKPAVSAVNKPPSAPEMKTLGVLMEKYSLNI
jgi:hypothetical protein